MKQTNSPHPARRTPKAIERDGVLFDPESYERHYGGKEQPQPQKPQAGAAVPPPAGRQYQPVLAHAAPAYTPTPPVKPPAPFVPAPAQEPVQQAVSGTPTPVFVVEPTHIGWYEVQDAVQTRIPIMAGAVQPGTMQLLTNETLIYPGSGSYLSSFVSSYSTSYVMSYTTSYATSYITSYVTSYLTSYLTSYTTSYTSSYSGSHASSYGAWPYSSGSYGTRTVAGSFNLSPDLTDIAPTSMVAAHGFGLELI
jgi:hypothetical protein